MALSESQIHWIIMDYLVNSNWSDLADEFYEMVDIPPVAGRRWPNVDLETREMIDKLKEMKSLFDRGYIITAVSLIIQYYPELPDNYMEMYREMQEQHVRDMIQQKKFKELVEYIKDQVIFEELEQSTDMDVALVKIAKMFPSDNPYSHLFQMSECQSLVDDPNVDWSLLGL